MSVAGVLGLEVLGQDGGQAGGDGQGAIGGVLQVRTVRDGTETGKSFAIFFFSSWRKGHRQLAVFPPRGKFVNKT